MKVIVFGGTGMLGSMVTRYLVNQGHDVTFTTREKLPPWFPQRRKLGVIKYDVDQTVPDLTGYDWAINCIGAIKQKQTATDVMYAINAVFPWKLVAASTRAGCRVIHVSTDCVFSGKSSFPYVPNAPLDAEDDYGKSKALGEAIGAVVLRTSIIGPAQEKHGLFEWFRTREKLSADGYTNHKWSGVTTLFLAQFMETLMTNPPVDLPVDGGLIQIASPEVSKCTLVKLINDVFDLKVRVSTVEAPQSVNRVLLPSTGTAPEIHDQLVTLRDWMKANG